LFRHNGHLVAIPTLGAAAWYFWPTSRRAVVWAAMVALVMVGLVVAATRAAHIPHAPVMLKQAPLIHQVAALVAAGTPLSQDDRQVLEQLAPLPTWTADYRCEAVGRILYRPHLREQLQRGRWQLLPVWAHLVAGNPRAFARHELCVTRYLWWPRSTLVIGPLFPDRRTVAPNSVGLATASVLPRVQRPLWRLVASTLRPDSILWMVVWQPALSLYLVLGSLVLALRRARSAAPLLVLFPLLCNTVLWLLMSPGPHFRFQWPLVLLAPVAVCVAAVSYPSTSVNADTQPRRAASISPSAPAPW
jgi:hypothetical protein